VTPSRRRLILITALLSVAVAVVVAGCGGKKEDVGPAPVSRFDLVLDYTPNPDHAGIYQAISDGSFRRAGLDVRAQVPSDPSAPLKLVAAGSADMAISYEPELLLARDKGLRLVSVGAVVQRPLTSIVALPASGIRKPADLRGKRVGTAGIPYQSDYLATILEHAGRDPRDVREINVGFNLVPAMLSKKVDATLGAFWNVEGVQLRAQRRNPVIIPVDQAGVPTYEELVLVVREDTARNDGPKLRRFLRALSQGYEAARRNPGAAVDALVAADRTLNRREMLASLEATLPAFFPAATDKPFGFQNPVEWRAYAAWMLSHRLLQRPANLLKALTNEFLPGEGVDTSSVS
jgi:putative hydroxymethylpyrimidine transport system substrate-binding protein